MKNYFRHHKLEKNSKQIDRPRKIYCYQPEEILYRETHKS